MRSILVNSLLVFLLGMGLSGADQGEGNGSSPLDSSSRVLPDSMNAYTESISGTIAEFEMVPIPAGSVTVDGTEHAVGPFWMAATEVRWDAYDAYRLDEKMEGLSEAEADAVSLPSKPYGFGDKIPGYGQEKYPALSITRNAAQEYARWLSARTEHTYRLPTAAEWKHACQVGHGSPSDWKRDQLRKHAWFKGNADETAHPTASLEPSDLGVHDQLGNAAELVAPSESTPDQKPEVWGGSYQSDATDVHCTARRQKTPAWQESDPQLPKSKWWLSDAQFVGVRLVRVPGSDAP